MLCKHLGYGSLLPKYPGLLSQAEEESNDFTLASITLWVTGSSYKVPVALSKRNGMTKSLDIARTRMSLLPEAFFPVVCMCPRVLTMQA